jgi:hypothetical protein
MMAMSSYPGAANDEEWITLAKEQMAAEGADPNANMLGISHVHMKRILGSILTFQRKPSREMMNLQ